MWQEGSPPPGDSSYHSQEQQKAVLGKAALGQEVSEILQAYFTAHLGHREYLLHKVPAHRPRPHLALPFPSGHAHNSEYIHMQRCKDTADASMRCSRGQRNRQTPKSDCLMGVSEQQRREIPKVGVFSYCAGEGQPCGETLHAQNTASLPNEQLRTNPMALRTVYKSEDMACVEDKNLYKIPSSTRCLHLLTVKPLANILCLPSTIMGIVLDDVR